MNANNTIATPAARQTMYRHPWPVRLWHWWNALAVVFLLITGLLVFNIHPRLYWGEDGHAGMPALASLSATSLNKNAPRFDLQLGSLHWDVSRLMGAIDDEGSDVYVMFAAPPTDFQFGATRTWHFAWAWTLALSWIAYALYLVAGKRLWLVLRPTRGELSWRNVGREVVQHLCFRRARGAAARHYNVLQKMTYLLVLFVLVPVIVLSGLTMSNTVTAVFPDLFSLFGGRQSARTIHFVAASLMVLFVVVHVIQVLVAGFVNSLRSMVTGRYTLPPEESV